MSDEQRRQLAARRPTETAAKSVPRAIAVVEIEGMNILLVLLPSEVVGLFR